MKKLSLAIILLSITNFLSAVHPTELALSELGMHTKTFQQKALLAPIPELVLYSNSKTLQCATTQPKLQKKFTEDRNATTRSPEPRSTSPEVGG
ncbi:MAG: hypothetical protein ACJAZS_000747 [Alteromonas naphthalenivorans]|jgi:hypothetical protein